MERHKYHPPKALKRVIFVISGSKSQRYQQVFELVLRVRKIIYGKRQRQLL
jgi:hypothetical protein